MEIKQLVESIVREIAQAMQAETVKPHRALYIFADSTAHEAYTDHFITLQNHGIAHDLMFLDGETSAWLGKHRIESGGPGKVIAVDEFAPAPLEVPLDYDGIIIPEIDLDNMGRATLGIRGTVLSDIIFSALVTEKFVLIGSDASGLKRADRRTLKTTQMPKPFQNLFDYYKQELSMYGAEFGARANLAEMVVDKCGHKAQSSPDIAGENADLEAGSGVFEGKLVTEAWVKQQLKAPQFAQLMLRKGTLVSPLARDLLKEKGITVRFADER